MFSDLCPSGVATPWHRYITASAVKALQRIEDADTDDDAKLQSAAERASDVMDLFCNRHFAVHTETKRFDAPHALNLDLAGEDLLAITSITNGDETDIPVASVIAYPLGVWPKRYMKPKPGLAYFCNGTVGYVSIAGLWGFHDNPIGAWARMSTVPVGGLTDSATTMVLAGAVGMETLLIDDEQIGVASVATVESVTTATLVRGVNGTTAAAHTAAKVVYRYQPATAVAHAAMTLAVWLYRRPDAPFDSIAMPDMGTMVIPSALPADIAKLLLALRRESYA